MTTTTLSASTTTTGVNIASGDDGTMVIKTGATAGAQVNAMSFAADGKISINGQTVSASVANTVTNKVAIVINGITYYLLASTSGT